MKKLNRILLIILVVLSGTASGQDVHFSQFTATPLLINPALTGTFTGDHRAFINYRNQWKSVGTPYKTYAVSYDSQFYRNKWDGRFLGAGLSIFNDKAGTSNLSTTQINLSLAGIVTIDEQQKISAGIQGGLTQMNIDYANLKWGNQFNDNVYNPNASPNEDNLNQEAFFYGDINAGLSWHWSKNETNISSKDQGRANAGISFYHLNKPTQKLFSADIERLYTKIVIHGSGNIGIRGWNSFFMPSFIIYKQGSSIEFTSGALFRYRLKEESRYTGLVKESSIALGLHYRSNDALIPSIVIDVSGFSMGISYDVNISDLSQATAGKGGIEISLRFINPNPNRVRGTKGPMF